MTSKNIYPISEKQMLEFKPTFLYIKQHTITGKMYFGKTLLSGNKFDSYKGSGTKWKRHIKKHGKEHVVNVWYCLFTDIQQLVQTAIQLQKIMQVTDSDVFYNLKEETGIDGGGILGRKAQKETKEKQQKQMSGKLLSQEHKSKNRQKPNGKNTRQKLEKD